MTISCAPWKVAIVCGVAGMLAACGGDDSTTGPSDKDASMVPSDAPLTEDRSQGEDAESGSAPGDDGNTPSNDGGGLDAAPPTDAQIDGGDASEASGDGGAEAGSDASAGPDSGVDAGARPDSGVDAGLADGGSDGGSLGTITCNGAPCDVAGHVCCYAAGGTQTCVAAGQCTGTPVACRGPANCTGGDVCCLSLAAGDANAAGKPAASCGTTLCTVAEDCVQGDTCSGGVCIPRPPGLDGGFPRFDGGFPGFDGGFFGFPDGG